MRRTDVISAGGLIALGLVTIFYLIPNYVAPSPWSGDLSPAFMPYVAAALGTVAMAWLLVERLVRAGDDAEPAPLARSSWVFIGSVAVVLAVTFVLFDRVGYLWGAAFIVAGFMVLAKASVRATVAAAVTFPVVLWVLFDRLLEFPLS